MIKTQELFDEAISLPIETKAKLINELLQSIHPLHIEIDNLWAAEAEKRVEEIKNGLGLEFAREVYLAIQNIIAFPLAWSQLSTNTKRFLINRFPYGPIYQISNEEILIIAVMQLNREPGYWEKRIKNL